MSQDFRSRFAVRHALVASLALATVPAMAQDGGAAEQLDTITVTGTRIQRQDYEATSPVATVSAETIRSTGQLNTEAVLNTLPQVVPRLLGVFE